ncbi:hypothetical protein SEA_DARDANUS_6 [Gordonia phage Dardanus]|uniref:Uncharacterized protein n=1 Tax=Gordonia phage Dardanus TaxID=2588489 RepID=A0A514CWZ8_9CAUD|nr:hypothetical protein KDJ58_gp06 [Gordonia phage Dardanus]QDH85043.1 hypothetical protein SEA_DARDANUS_6 [Gordonia phage Dardanus]
MMNIYEQHESRKARILPALAGTDRNNRISEADLLAKLGPDAEGDLIDLAATGAIGGSWRAGYYRKRETHNGRH